MAVPQDSGVASIVGVIDTFLRWNDLDTRRDRSYIKYHPSEWGKCLRRQQYLHYESLGLVEVKREAHASRQTRLFNQGSNMHLRWQNWYMSRMGCLRGYWECKNQYCKLWDDGGNLQPKATQLLELWNQDKKNGEEQLQSSRIYGMDETLGCFRPEKCVCGSTDFGYEEVTVKDDDLNIIGHADAVLDFSQFDPKKFEGIRSTFNVDKLPKKTVVVDFKTVNDYGYKSQVAPLGPHKAYIIQIIIYTHILDCEYGIILYENKNDSNLAAFRVDRNDEVFDTVKWQTEKMQQMDAFKMLPPPKPLTKADTECKRCEFASICHSKPVWDDPKLKEKRIQFYRKLL
jgi:hypothetical protein